MEDTNQTKVVFIQSAFLKEQSLVYAELVSRPFLLFLGKIPDDIRLWGFIEHPI